MAKRYWNMGIVRLFNDVLYEEALSQTPNGLRYHLIDICVEELAKVNKDATVPLTEATILDCLEPFFAMAQRVDDKNVQKRVVNSVLLKFLNEYSFVSDVAIREENNDEDEDTSKLLVFGQVHVGTVAKFIFEIASDADTDERYRKGLYELHKTFVRQIRLAGRDVDPEDEREDEEEAFCGVCEEQVQQINDDEPSAATSKKEKKKKKKQKIADVDSEAAESAPETSPQKDESMPSTKSKKKKKRKNHDTEEPAVETPVVKERDEHSKEADSKPSTKASKKKKRKKQTEEPDTAEKQPNPSESSDVTPVSKKKKKKQNGVGKAENNEANTTPNSSDGEGQYMMSASKRVSFGAMNQSKSHKASMKALKTLTPKVWSTANRTPDRSILLKKAVSEAKEKKASRTKKGKKSI